MEQANVKMLITTLCPVSISSDGALCHTKPLNQVFRDAISTVRPLGMYVSEFVQNHREEDVDVDRVTGFAFAPGAGAFRAILGLPLARLVGGSRHRFLIYKVEGEMDSI